MSLGNLVPTLDFVVGGVVVGLILAAIRAYRSRRKLYVVVPRLFDYSELSDSGQIAELTIRNRGTRVEHELCVQLSQKFKYEVLASTISGISIDSEGVIKIARLSKQDEISLVLNVEGGEFRSEHVVDLSSRDTKGEVKTSLEESEEPTPFQITIVILFIVLFMPAFGYFIGSTVGEDLWENVRPTPEFVSEAKTRLEGSGWLDFERFIRSYEYAYYKGEWPIEVSFPQREGQLLRFNITFSNKLSRPVTFRASSASPFNSQEYDGFINDSEFNVLTLPGNKTTRILEAFVPYESDEKVVFFDFSMQAKSETYYFQYKWTYP